MEILRGQIYYVNPSDYANVGSEIRPGRPAVVVSNDHLNATSSVIEVVYLTTQEKKDMPTHVKTESSGKPSTVLAEQISTVSIDRIGGYCGECTPEEMAQIDEALMMSLGIERATPTARPDYAGTLRELVDAERAREYPDVGYVCGAVDFYLAVK